MRHQIVAFELGVRLRANCLKDLRVLTAPSDVTLGDAMVIQPDVLVARRSDFSENDLPVAPVLAVGVLSPSTRSIDHISRRTCWSGQAARATGRSVSPTPQQTTAAIPRRAPLALHEYPFRCRPRHAITHP